MAREVDSPLGNSPTPESLRATLIIRPITLPPAQQPDSAPSPIESTQHSQRTYIVSPGDTLWSIASTLNPGASDSHIYNAVIDLWRINESVIGKNADLILPGQELIIPNR